ncbi:hypothetical protein PAPYR_6706 [Paratrimastix pyriformis]|uniref:Uncharacterized protein n=1 Tax=Paratrimastix pyriformis TaxID=342808 RepID=A0ABQ8UHV7_9EUKA|nr:hypothetical protein PAPYR_6706 [Paratrimastix pyriformis]
MNGTAILDIIDRSQACDCLPLSSRGDPNFHERTCGGSFIVHGDHHLTRVVDTTDPPAPPATPAATPWSTICYLAHHSCELALTAVVSATVGLTSEDLGAHSLHLDQPGLGSFQFDQNSCSFATELALSQLGGFCHFSHSTSVEIQIAQSSVLP